MLKHYVDAERALEQIQPPLGGCVLKLILFDLYQPLMLQPPLGGCVLKPFFKVGFAGIQRPAAFRRLCVETLWIGQCVLLSRPAAFRRLCVETQQGAPRTVYKNPSRLQAAVC